MYYRVFPLGWPSLVIPSLVPPTIWKVTMFTVSCHCYLAISLMSICKKFGPCPSRALFHWLTLIPVLLNPDYCSIINKLIYPSSSDLTEGWLTWKTLLPSAPLFSVVALYSLTSHAAHSKKVAFVSDFCFRTLTWPPLKSFVSLSLILYDHSTSLIHSSIN